jgi:hypothetical protein
MSEMRMNMSSPSFDRGGYKSSSNTANKKKGVGWLFVMGILIVTGIIIGIVFLIKCLF